MSLRKQAILGIKFSAVITVMKIVLPVITYSILLRFLSAEELGLYTMVFSFISLINLFQDAGLGQSVIHFQNSSDNELSSIFMLNSIVGVVFTIIIYFSATFVSSFYAELELIRLVEIMALSFLFSSIGQLHLALLKKISKNLFAIIAHRSCSVKIKLKSFFKM